MEEIRLFLFRVIRIVYVILAFGYLASSVYKFVTAITDFKVAKHANEKFFAFMFAPAAILFVSFIFTLYCGLLIRYSHTSTLKFVILMLNICLCYYLFTHWFRFS